MGAGPGCVSKITWVTVGAGGPTGGATVGACIWAGGDQCAAGMGESGTAAAGAIWSPGAEATEMGLGRTVGLLPVGAAAGGFGAGATC